MYAAIPFLIIVGYLLLKLNFVVFDRNVFNFQISHIEARGHISSLREYRAIHNFVEQEFDRDPDRFESSSRIAALNQMLTDFHANQ